MSPHELKELPIDSEDDLEDGAVLISDEENDSEAGELEPPFDPEADPVLVDVENDDEDEEDEDEEEEKLDEVGNDDDDEDGTSEGGKVDDDDENDGEEEGEDDDSDDEDESEEKRPFNNRDHEDEDDEDNEDDDAGVSMGDDEDNAFDEEEGEEDEELPTKRKRYTGGKSTAVGRGKVMPGVSFPLTSRQEYKGDIEDLLRAAAQAEKGETSTANSHTDSINNLVSAVVTQSDVGVTEVTVKEEGDIECAVVDILEDNGGDEEEEEDDEQEEDDLDADDDSDYNNVRHVYRTAREKIKIFKDSSDEESQNMSDDGIPPTKRTKTL